MTKEEIDILFKTIELYKYVVAVLDCEDKLNKLNATMIEDTLLRLKSGEYKIVTNKDY
jgi:hypothetical protein